VGIEARTLLMMLNSQIVPACTKFAGQTAQSIAQIKASGVMCDTQAIEEVLRKTTSGISSLVKGMKKLERAVEKFEKFGDDFESQARFARDSIVSVMNEVRKYADELEVIVGKEYWPIPTYSDLIYSV